MLNRFTKLLLVGTSLSPTLLIMAVDYFATETFEHWFCFGTQLIIVALSFMAIAVLVMAFARKYGSKQHLIIRKAKNSDKEVLTFLLAYLLPILTDHKYLFKEFNAPTLAVLLLLCTAVYHTNAFDFSPLLGLLGYHFYEVEDDDSFPYLLISKTSIKKPCATIEVVQLFDYTFLAVER